MTDFKEALQASENAIKSGNTFDEIAKRARIGLEAKLGGKWDVLVGT
jgi:hypothetical protein